MTEHAYEFTRAITRLPASSIVHGLRAEDVGNPDHAQMLLDHAHYVSTLREAGAGSPSYPHSRHTPMRFSSRTSRFACPEWPS